MNTLRRWNAQIDAVGSVRAIAVLRILLGGVVLVHLRPFVDGVREGVIYSDRFYEPYVDWFPEAGSDLYTALVWTAVVAAVTMSAGLASRLSTAYLACFVAYNLGLSTTHFHHNRAFLLIVLVGVALLHPGDALSIDALIRRRRHRGPPPPRPLWPLWLLRIQVAAVYLASATSKLVDPDWWGGTVLQIRAVSSRKVALDSGAPAWALDILADGTFQWWFSKTVVLTELFIGFGLLHRKTRLLAVWIAVWFHVSIEITARVQVFSWAALAALCIWVTPRERDRQLIMPNGRWRPVMVRRLDWFARLDVQTDDGRRTVLVDHVATDLPVVTRHGRPATLLALSRLPATFMVAGPLALLARLREP